jgi:hypothetical protein
MEGLPQRSMQEELGKNEKRNEKSHSQGQKKGILTAYDTRSWNVKEQDVMI